MRPRFGRLYAAAVLRPFAEQLVRLLELRGGDTVCDLICDGGALTAALADAVGREGSVLAADLDPHIVQVAVQEARHAGARVQAMVVDGERLPVPDGSCDRVASLFTLGFAGAGLVVDASRVVRQRAGLVAVVWDTEHPPAHEAVIERAVRDITGERSRFLDQLLRGATRRRSAVQVTTLVDVVRFDGFEHFWVAMVEERPLRNELAQLDATAVAAVRAACGQSLEEFAAADGTLRIPVTALAISG